MDQGEGAERGGKHHRTAEKGISPMSEADELGAMVDRLADRVRALEDHIEIT